MDTAKELSKLSPEAIKLIRKTIDSYWPSEEYAKHVEELRSGMGKGHTPLINIAVKQGELSAGSYIERSTHPRIVDIMASYRRGECSYPEALEKIIVHLLLENHDLKDKLK